MDKNKWLSWMIPAFFILAVGIFILFLGRHTSDITNENRTYNRFIACGLSVPAEERTRTKIDMCWDKVQEDTGTNVKRYDMELER